MRIAFLSYQWPGFRMGGIGSYVRQSAGALALAGHEVHVFTVGDGDTSPENVPAGVVLHQTLDPANRVASGQLPAELSAVVSTGGEAVYRLAIGQLLTTAFAAEHASRTFDIVEVADVDASGLPLLLNSARTLPVVVHLHTCSAIANRIHLTGVGDKIGEQEQLIEAMEAAQIHLADAVCAPTNAVVQSTRELIRIDRDPVIIPHSFVYTNEPFEPPSDGPILYIGRLEWRKGCGVIAEILGEFLERNPSAQFRFIGPDTSSAPGGGSVRNHLSQSLPGAKRVDFTGELSASDVTLALRNCSFCVLPSLSENFSLAICEAMAAGRTTIVAAGTGSVEVLGDAGVSVDLGSAQSLLTAMDDLYKDRQRLNSLSKLTFERIRNFCDPVTVSNLRVGFYEQVIRNFNRGRSKDRLQTLAPDLAAALLPCIARMTAALMRVDQPTDSPGDRLNNICQSLNGGKPAGVLLLGAGKYTARLLSQRHCWERHGHRVVGLIDDHPRFLVTKTYLGLPVRSLLEVETDAASGVELPPVVLSTDTYQDQFWEQTKKLRDCGVKVFRLYGA